MDMKVKNTNAVFDEAVRCVYAHVLRDMRPPWLEHSFPQALPGDGVLSRYTRPCFLAWSYSSCYLLRVFGERVMDFLARVVEVVGLRIVGVVARPVYVCTGKVPGGICMAMASMSRIFEEGTHRGAFLCKECARQRGATPVCESEPLRALLLYALVKVAGGAGTVLRMKPVRAVVSAPPARWRWGGAITNEPWPTPAQPNRKLLKKGSHWRYNKSESEQIWCLSQPFRSTASV